MSSDPDALKILEIVGDINFDNMTQKQAQQLGLSLGVFNDAIEHKNAMFSGLRAASSAFGAAFVGGITLYFVDQSHTLHGILCGLLIYVGMEVLNFWRATQAVCQAGTELNDDIKQLREQQSK